MPSCLCAFLPRKDADGICANAGWHCLCTIKSQNTLENLNPIKLYDFIFFEFPILLFSRFTFVICAFAWIGLAMDGGWNECYTYGVPVISFTFPSIFTIQMDSNQKARLLHNFRHWAKTHWRWLWHLFFPCTYVQYIYMYIFIHLFRLFCHSFVIVQLMRAQLYRRYSISFDSFYLLYVCFAIVAIRIRIYSEIVRLLLLINFNVT